jgi:hypothetical protein
MKIFHFPGLKQDTPKHETIVLTMSHHYPLPTEKEKTGL